MHENFPQNVWALFGRSEKSREIPAKFPRKTSLSKSKRITDEFLGLSAGAQGENSKPFKELPLVRLHGNMGFRRGGEFQEVGVQIG